nr:reverse transcriptase domain-containing protein [Tanacetum cinerariifolium]
MKSPSESPEFFLPKELLSPKKQKQDQSFQDYEMGESSHDSTLEQHEKQIEEILNHLDELPLDCIERIEDDVDGLADNSIREIPIAKRENYKEFISCQHFYFNGTEGGIRLIRWFERTESVFSRSNCAEENKVAFATDTLTNDALSWWNAYAQPIGMEQANRITWTELKRLLTSKYCPRTKIKNMEDEFYNLSAKGNDLKTYVRRFQELAVLCPNMNIHNNRTNDFRQQQNKRPETFRSYAATLTENCGYTGNRPLCQRCTLHHTGPCTIRCRVCNKIGHLTKNCRNKGPATGKELPGLPPVRQVEFKIDLIPRAAPVARAPYRLAPSEMQELS